MMFRKRAEAVKISALKNSYFQVTLSIDGQEHMFFFPEKFIGETHLSQMFDVIVEATK